MKTLSFGLCLLVDENVLREDVVDSATKLNDKFEEAGSLVPEEVNILSVVFSIYAVVDFVKRHCDNPIHSLKTFDTSNIDVGERKTHTVLTFVGFEDMEVVAVGKFDDKVFVLADAHKDGATVSDVGRKSLPKFLNPVVDTVSTLGDDVGSRNSVVGDFSGHKSGKTIHESHVAGTVGGVTLPEKFLNDSTKSLNVLVKNLLFERHTAVLLGSTETDVSGFPSVEEILSAILFVQFDELRGQDTVAEVVRTGSTETASGTVGEVDAGVETDDSLRRGNACLKGEEF